MRHLLSALIAGTLLASPGAASAMGFGYAFEMHQLRHRVVNGPDVKLEMPVHRIKLIDSTGLLATILASARYDREVEISEYQRKTTETFWSEYTPMPRGIRVQLVYAFNGSDADAQVEGGPVDSVATEYREFRFAVGAQLPADQFYVDFDMIDMVSRDLSGPTRIDKFAWNINLEAGGYAGPLRIGLRGELDLVSAVESIFDGYPLASAWGVAAYYDTPVGSLTALWRSYTRAADDLGGVADGRSITIGGHFEF